MWQGESDSVCNDVCEDIDFDAGDEYYSDVLSHDQVLQLQNESDDESEIEGVFL